MTARPSDRERRLDANRLGRRAETIASLWLTVRGYRVLGRGFAVKDGEIDVIARRGGVVAFVEVKRRATLDEARLAITGAKRRRIERAASVWLGRNPWACAFTLRGDALLLAPRCWPCHVEDAFDLDIGH